VIDNLHPGVMEILVRIFLSLDLLFTAALFLFPTSEILEFALLDRTLFGKSRTVEMQRNLLRFIMVMVTAAVALAIPFFSVMTGLTGVFGSNLLGFLLPPSIYIKLKFALLLLLLLPASLVLRFVVNGYCSPLLAPGTTRATGRR
jgi:hypothetical protein